MKGPLDIDSRPTGTHRASQTSTVLLLTDSPVLPLHFAPSVLERTAQTTTSTIDGTVTDANGAVSPCRGPATADACVRRMSRPTRRCLTVHGIPTNSRLRFTESLPQAPPHELSSSRFDFRCSDCKSSA